MSFWGLIKALFDSFCALCLQQLKCEYKFGNRGIKANGCGVCVKADYANEVQTNAINKSGLKSVKLKKDERNKRNKGEVSSTKHAHIVFGARLGSF